MQVLGGCIVLMKQKASFVSASFNESRYEIQGFLHTLFLENEAQTSEKKKPKQCISSKTKSTCQNSTTSEHFQKWPKNQGVVLALSLSIVDGCCWLPTEIYIKIKQHFCCIYYCIAIPVWHLLSCQGQILITW